MGLFNNAVDRSDGLLKKNTVVEKKMCMTRH